jgi:hypothetical protein
MDYILTNILPIAAAAAVGLAILYVSARPRFTPGRIAVAGLASFWLGSILAGALILAPVTASPWTIALGSAFIIWVGFVLPVLATGLALRGHPASTCLVDAALWLAVMLAQAAVMQGIGLTKPAAAAAPHSPP